jgi:trehalose 6-phosphate phosphatase
MKKGLQQYLWVFDFDGTLSTLVPERNNAELHPACRIMLRDLVKNPRNHVAVLSSRALDDLSPRVPVRGIFLGGGSGTEWRIPGLHRVTLGGKGEQRLMAARALVMESLEKISDLPGIELEDKRWSVALHTRKAAAAVKTTLLSRLETWAHAASVVMLEGPEVIEIQLLQEVNKEFGVRMLCSLLKYDPSDGSICYAGDDRNDAVAMRWVKELGGVAITVGETPLVDGATSVRDQLSLVREIRRIAGLDDAGNSRKSAQTDPVNVSDTSQP